MAILASIYMRKKIPPINSQRKSVLQKRPHARDHVGLTSTTCPIFLGAAGKLAVIIDCGGIILPTTGVEAATPVTIGTWDMEREVFPRCAPHCTQNCWLAAFWEPQLGHVTICCIFFTASVIVTRIIYGVITYIKGRICFFVCFHLPVI
jgi:hypothetical protein